MFILEQRIRNDLQTKIPHIFHLINQNGMSQSFPHIHKYRKTSSNLYFLKVILLVTCRAYYVYIIQ